MEPLARLGRAEEALNAARLLYSGGFPRDSVNRAHLAMELAALAMLTRHGFGSKSHRGVQALFFEHVANQARPDADGACRGTGRSVA
ncbi:HEPN domain-containing protein [Azospirillum melinis]